MGIACKKVEQQAHKDAMKILEKTDLGPLFSTSFPDGDAL
jgi:hypothetical protein